MSYFSSWQSSWQGDDDDLVEFEDDLIEQEDGNISLGGPPPYRQTYDSGSIDDPTITVVPVVVPTTPAPLILKKGRGRRRAVHTEPQKTVRTTSSKLAQPSTEPLKSPSGALPQEPAQQITESLKLPAITLPFRPAQQPTGSLRITSSLLPADPPLPAIEESFRLDAGLLQAQTRQERPAETFRAPSGRLVPYPIVPTSPFEGEPVVPPSGPLQVITGPLDSSAGPLPIVAATPSLTAALQATLTTGPAQPLVVIPGSRKPRQAERNMPAIRSRRMSPRIRQGIVFASLLVIFIMSLFTLTPLSNDAAPIFWGISSLLQGQQQSWQLPAHTEDNTLPRTLPYMAIPNSQYVATARQDAIAAGISPDYFVRQITQESNFNPNAVSPAGAEGIAQFMPATAATLGINPWDPNQALQGASQLMASYNRQYGGDYAMALAAYNAGTGAVQHAVAICGSNWLQCVPYETQNYVWVIMGI